MTTMSTLLSIQVGKPQQYAAVSAANKPLVWSTGIYKQPVEGRVWLGLLNLDGDGQADLTVHGGRNKAVMVYSAEHYPFWREQLPKVEFVLVALGENFTASQTGRPSAPARCASEVSTVMTRSRFSITAAASMKASGPSSKSLSRSTVMPGGRSSSCSAP